MNRLSRTLLIFALLYAFLLIGPALLSKSFGPYPLMKTGDVLDLLTPLVLIPLYWLLFELEPGRTPSRREAILFLVLASCWVMGQGMHLAANSIGHLLPALPENDAYTLTHFYDEVLSHYLWHGGIVGLAALLIYRQWRQPLSQDGAVVWPAVVGGVIYGFNYFLTITEGATAPLGVPFALLVTLVAAVWGRGKVKGRPVLTFFFVAFLVATLFFAGWALYWGGLPEFSEVGIID